jgi:[ribosomal protein S5]-alanine N-acetyltransferase
MIAEQESRAHEGPRVRLRPATPEDLKRTFDWYNDPEVVAPFDRFSVDSFEEFERSVRDAVNDPASLAPRYVVALREGDIPIGFVGHYVPHPVLETVDVWYVIGDRRARRHGYASEAVELLVTHLFETTTLVRIGATVDVDNQPSLALLERLGFKREGVLRSALFHHARWHDIALYGVIRDEWAKRPRAA